MYWLDLKSHRLHYASISWRLACTRLRRDVKEERAARLLTLICGCRLQGWRRSSRPLKRTVSQLYLQTKASAITVFPTTSPSRLAKWILLTALEELLITAREFIRYLWKFEQNPNSRFDLQDLPGLSITQEYVLIVRQKHTHKKKVKAGSCIRLICCKCVRQRLRTWLWSF